MKTFNLLVLLSVIVVFSSCKKDDNTMTDGQLIDAIKNAPNKSEINFTDLPNSSKEIINKDYSDLSIENALLAPELGYEVNMADNYFSKEEVKEQAYFDMSGRLLTGKDNDIDSKKGGKDKNDCYSFIYPIQFSIGDALVTINSDEELKDYQIRWKELDVKPILIYPVNLYFGDKQITLENDTEFKRVKEACKGVKKECYSFLYPVTYIAGDELVVINNEEELKSAYTRWKETGIKAILQYPFDIKWYEGTIQTIRSEEEMIEAKKKCNDWGKD